jgi:hypothetical protein
VTAYLTFPYQVDGSGRTATSDLPAYVEALLRLVLQTDPGERVNQPEFGAGLKSLVFAGMDDALASAAETLIRSKLLQFMGSVITIQSLSVTLQDDAARVDLTYVITASGQQMTQVVTQSLPGTDPGAVRSASAGRPNARLSEA